MKHIIKFAKKVIAHLRNDGWMKTIGVVTDVLKEKTLAVYEIGLDYHPIKNTVVFECESDMDDNPRAVYEYMLSAGLNRKYRLVWVVKNIEYCRKEYKAYNVRFVSRYSDNMIEIMKLQYYLSTARWFVFSHPFWFRKKKDEQLVIFTDHSNPMKGGNSDIAAKTSDVKLVTSEWIREMSAKCWNYPLDRTFICGFPRNDFLKRGRKAQIFTELFPWLDDAKVIMCMPTYKKSAIRTDISGEDRYALGIIRTEDQFLALDNFLSEKNIHLIIKLHPLQVTGELNMEGTEHIHYLQNKELFEKKILLYELLGCCDGLVTDFSSVHYDFLTLDRPIAFVLKDMDKYTRGFVMENPLEYMPGEKIYTFGDLLEFIGNLAEGIDRYADDRRKLNKLVNGMDTECNSGQFVEMMLSGEMEEILHRSDGENV